jgi:Putative NADP-dependent oxidoreductases
MTTAPRRTPALIITRPSRDEPYTPDVLKLVERELPALDDGELLVRVLYLSLDPTNRNWLKLLPVNTVKQKIGRDLKVGDAMVGEVIGEVIESRSAEYAPGDLVTATAEWQHESIVPADRVRRVDRGPEPLAAHLTIFSHIGMAAMVGLDEIARIQPGETVLVSAAAGATGRLAVAIAASRGCRVVALAGGERKCAQALASGADVAIDYKATPDLAAALVEAAPDGFDVYFDNVGGATLDAALMAMAPGGRIAVCGVMSDYDGDVVGIRNMFQVLVRHLRIEGFLAGRYWHRRDVYYAELRRLLAAGRIEHHADQVGGLENAPSHLLKLFAGTNEGKLLVQVAADAHEL